VEANPVVANTEASSDPDVPAMWRIDAAAPNMEQIYAQSDEVVEVVHTMDAEPVVYAHESTEPVQSTTSGVISLDIHPAQALGVRLDGLPELEPTLRQGFEALGNESWAQAAIAFQKLAARMPGDAAVFNNYGLSLLQRALTMAKSPDLELQTLASTQFESSILALREAAKSAPTEGYHPPQPGPRTSRQRPSREGNWSCADARSDTTPDDCQWKSASCCVGQHGRKRCCKISPPTVASRCSGASKS
jgi:hypothetical protein